MQSHRTSQSLKSAVGSSRLTEAGTAHQEVGGDRAERVLREHRRVRVRHEVEDPVREGRGLG